MSTTLSTARGLTGRQLTERVFEPMKSVFIGKDDIIDLLAVAVVAGENLFILGPPGTAKSAIVRDLGQRLEGEIFEYLLTRFTEPNELFGPFDIRQLREGNLVTNTDSMLPAATLVFLDELFNANSAILNCLLTVLNERFFRRGREAFAIPALTFVGASNRLPEDEILRALFDRFLLRVGCDNVPGDRLSEVAAAGWRLDLALEPPRDRVDTQDIRRLHNRLRDVNFDLLRPSYVELIHRLRRAGIEISDRRAVKCQRLVAASALLCDRSQADLSDLWVLRYIWDAEEQQEILREIVQEFVERDDSTVARHPRARHDDRPDPEQLARDLDHLRSRLEASDPASEEATQLNDQLGLLAGRCEWVTDESAREFLQQRLAALWRLQGSTAGVAER